MARRLTLHSDPPPVSDAEVDSLISDVDGHLNVDRRFLMRELLKLYQLSNREATKLRCIELLAKVTGAENEPDEDDEDDIFKSYTESLRNGNQG